MDIKNRLNKIICPREEDLNLENCDETVNNFRDLLNR